MESCKSRGFRRASRMSSSSSYQFLPRKLIKRKPNGSADANQPTSKPPVPHTPLPVASTAVTDSQKQKNLRDEHIAIWVNLAMSDYAVWSDPDLRRALDSGDDGLESNCERWVHHRRSAIVTRLITRYSPQVSAAQFSASWISRRT